MIDLFLKENLHQKLSENLKEINDLERLHRKMSLNTLHPHEFYGLDFSYQHISNIIVKLKKYILFNSFSIEQSLIDRFDHYKSTYNKIFIIDELAKNNLHNIYSSFIREGVDEKLDNVIKKIIDKKKEFQKIAKELSNLVESGSEAVKVEHTEKEGYYLQCTKKSEILKNSTIRIIIASLG